MDVWEACHRKGQAAIDYLVSYGIAIIILTIAIAVIYNLGLLNPLFTPVSCTPAPSFSCGLFYINQNGILYINISQSVGSTITVQGLSCSTAYNSVSDTPEYGNIYTSNSASYYPTGESPNNGITFYSGSSNTFVVNCYGPGGIVSGALGNIFFGHVWLNYTIPQYGSVTQSIAAVTVKYS